MGALADCIVAGVPKAILVPILPVTETFDNKSYGKAPAKFNSDTGSWGALEEWQRGNHDPSTTLLDADTAGGNAGLILGAPMDGFQFLAVDIDLQDLPGAVGWRNGIVLALQRQWGKTLLVRETWPYRALLLVNIPTDASPGAKKVFTLFRRDPKDQAAQSERIGKVEILAHGQQCVIAGKHFSGNDITWYGEDGSGQTAPRFPAPMVKEDVPTFQTFDELLLAIVSLLDAMAPYGYTYSALNAGLLTGTAPALRELAAPSAKDLADLLDAMPNPRSVDRDAYIAVILAVAGARAGLVDDRGALSFEDENLIAYAVAGWAIRWDAPPGSAAGAFDEELSKWNEDLGRPREERFAGWRQLLQHAQAFGATASVLNDIAMDRAQNQFKADTTATPTPDTDYVTGYHTLSVDDIAWRQDVNPDSARTSDFGVADRVRSHLVGSAVWIPPLRCWLVWNGVAGWQSDDMAESTAQKWIMGRLWWYAGVYGKGNPGIGMAAWGPSTHDKMLSKSKAANVEAVLKVHLALSLKHVNRGDLKVQTPTDMFDIVSMEPVEIMQRKSLHETRSTGVNLALTEPSPSSTRYFDKLTLDLCDGNEEVRDWLLLYLGYCLLGDPKDDVFVVIYGTGQNGKSTLINVLLHVLGSYATSLNSEVIMESGRGMHPASLNRLRNKRLALVSELKKGEKWNEHILKSITGGDEIEARDMNKNPTPFRSQAGVMILSNEKPNFSSVEPAIQRRFRLINTVVQRPEAEKIADLEERIIKDESPFVLRKLMGCAQKVYQLGRLPPAPPAMEAYAAENMGESDIIYAWLRAECFYRTAEHAESYELIEDLQKRCESYIKRAQGGQGGMVADKLVTKEFLERLRREGISLEDPTKLDASGRPTRHRRRVKKNGMDEVCHVAMGIKLKVPGVVAA